MITLANISTKRLVSYAQIKSVSSEKFLYIYELLTRNNIRNYQELKALLENKLFLSDSFGVVESLNFQLKKVQTKLKEAIDNGRDLRVYTFDDYGLDVLDGDTLRVTEKETRGGVLLFKNPIYPICFIEEKLDNFSISQIKDMLGYLNDRNLNNELNVNVQGLGQYRMQKFLASIKFYEEQVIRQAKDTTLRGVDLFSLNKELKRKIVEEQIGEIANYFLKNASVCVWGDLNDFQKRKIMEAVFLYKNDSSQMIKNRLIDVISNYTTLSELEKGVVKQRTLDRFIVR